MHLFASLTLKAGPKGRAEPLVVPCGTVTLFVGPNHSGKSVVLNEIRNSISQREVRGTKVLGGRVFHPLDEKIVARLTEIVDRACAPSTEQPGAIELKIDGNRRTLSKGEVDCLKTGLREVAFLNDAYHPWGHNQLNRLGLLLNGPERLGILNATARGDLRGPQTGALGGLFRNDTRRAAFQKITHSAFGWYFVLNWVADNQFQPAISDEKPDPKLERSLTEEALAFFGRCRDFNTSSDGVKAYCGMIAAVMSSEAKVILIDEPEAFLHPALCGNLAQELCRQARVNDHQLMIATHSAAFLLGCIHAGVDINIVRLTFRNNAPTSRMLPPGEVVPLMRNPLLRSVDALSGLFHESVVVTEADADRALYDEVNQRCLAAEDPRGIPECLFLNAQNWQTVARVAAPLRKLGIAAAVVVDADVVQTGDAPKFQEMLGLLGVPDGTRVALGQLRGKFNGRSKPEKDDLKKRGVGSLQGGDKGDFETVVQTLAAYGIFVVLNGELEAWLPALRRNPWASKPEWLIATFEAMGDDAVKPDYAKPTPGDVWGFIGQIREWLHAPARKGMPD